jgi:hypothetical protein
MKDLHDIQTLLAIDDRSLDTEMVEFSATYGYWVGQTPGVQRNLLVAEHDRDVTAARLDIQIRAELAEADEAAQVDALAEPDPKKRRKPKAQLTEPAVKALVTQHPEMVEAERHYIGARVEYERVRGIVTALASKGDFLRSLGARIRAEMERDPEVRIRHERTREFERLKREANGEMQTDLDL